MRSFDIIQAASFEHAAELMSRPATDAMAGGTDLLNGYKHAILKEHPEVVVNLKAIPDSAGIEETENGITVKAMTTLTAVTESSVVNQHAKGLAEAAVSVAVPNIRNLATIGGNVCQDVRCWFYRYPHEVGGRLDCMRKGGTVCYAVKGENRYHSIYGGMKAGCAGCVSQCPAGTDIPGYMEEIRKGDWAAAADIFFRYNPMPMMTSRICPHLCKDGCAQKTYGESVNIPAVERTLGDYVLEHKEKYYAAPEKESGKKVAVVGAGPGGLAAAFYLRKAGHTVTVYDAHEKPGGVLQYGIPHYRLPRSVVDAFCGALSNIMGIHFVMNTRIGTDIGVETLRAEYDAVYFGTGAWSQPILGLDGENLTQFGLNFLVEVNTYLKAAVGEQVLVCGGGNVAMDVALTAKRLGAKKVTLICLEQREEMPASPEEIAIAEEEGVEIHNSWGLGRVLTDEEGKVKGLESKRCLSVRDEHGKFRPKYDEEDRCVFESDFIILATGQKVDISFLGEKLGSQLQSARGLIDADVETGKTSAEGYYAGGDAVTGPDLAIRAIRAGRSSAETISRDLGVESKNIQTKTGFLTFDAEGVKNNKANRLPEVPIDKRNLTDEDFHSYDSQVVLNEAKRCMNCGCYSVNASDISPVLVALDAELITTKKKVKAADFFTTNLKAYDMLDRDELVTAISIPKHDGYQTGYIKDRLRPAIDFALTSLAYKYKLEDGIIQDITLVYGGVAPIPLKLTKVEEFLMGKAPSAELAEEAAELAVKECNRMDKNAYKILGAKAMVKQLIEVM